MTKYRRWYDALMARAALRPPLIGYCERHHVVPRSLGGSNARSNIVALTYREHFLAHWLLTKFTEGAARIKMLHALNRMRHNPAAPENLTGLQYAVARRANRDALMNPTVETRRKMAAAKLGNKINRGRKHTDETRAKMSNERKTRSTPSAETRGKLSAKGLGNKNRLGVLHRDETRVRMSEAHKLRWEKRKAAGI